MELYDVTQVAGFPIIAPEAETHYDGGFVPLFDGVSLAGWRSVPRVYGTEYPGGPSILERFESLGLDRPVEPEKHPALLPALTLATAIATDPSIPRTGSGST